VPNTVFTRIRTCALTIAAVLFIGDQASAQPPQRGPNVKVVNTPLPVTVTNPSIPGTPVAFVLSPLPEVPNVFPVPAGQRLVIEYISGACNTGGGITIQLTTGGFIADHFVTIPSGNIPNMQFGHLVKLYADPGTNVTVFAPGGLVCHVSFSGLLVKTP
jgi:hypothetical protein